MADGGERNGAERTGCQHGRLGQQAGEQDMAASRAPLTGDSLRVKIVVPEGAAGGC